jgi:hypothetical protein
MVVVMIGLFSKFVSARIGKLGQTLLELSWVCYQKLKFPTGCSSDEGEEELVGCDKSFVVGCAWGGS